MAGNTIGCVFCVTTWGESHGAATGAVIDGCPAGMDLAEADIQQALDRRKPSKGAASTSRGEKDRVEILSGVFEGKTTGTPIALLIRNIDARPSNYDDLKDVFRPGHGDYTYYKKYGVRDWRGGWACLGPGDRRPRCRWSRRPKSDCCRRHGGDRLHEKHRRD